MMINSNYKNKFETLGPFIEELCVGIKKEIKQEFVKKKGIQANFNSLDISDMSQFFYKKVVEEGDEKIGEWLASSWIYKNGEIFQFFHEQLSFVDKHYDRLESLSSEVEQQIKDLSVSKFGFVRIYLFSVLNSVVFSAKLFEELKRGALKELSMSKESSLESKGNISVEELKKSFEVERLKTEEKYEKRLQGVIKKTQMEVEGYRKQIGQLQKRLENESLVNG
jgi:hypothetical protein